MIAMNKVTGNQKTSEPCTHSGPTEKSSISQEPADNFQRESASKRSWWTQKNSDLKESHFSDVTSKLDSLGNPVLRLAWNTLRKANEDTSIDREAIRSLEEALVSRAVGEFPCLLEREHLAVRLREYYRYFREATLYSERYFFKESKMAPIYRAFEGLIAKAEQPTASLVDVYHGFFRLYEAVAAFNVDRPLPADDLFKKGNSKRQWVALLGGRLSDAEREMAPCLIAWLCEGSVIHPLDSDWLRGFISRFAEVSMPYASDMDDIFAALQELKSSLIEGDVNYREIQARFFGLHAIVRNYVHEHKPSCHWLIEFLEQQLAICSESVKDGGAKLAVEKIHRAALSREQTVRSLDTYQIIYDLLVSSVVDGVHQRVAVLNELFSKSPHLVNVNLVLDYLTDFNCLQSDAVDGGNSEDERSAAFQMLTSPILTSSAAYDSIKSVLEAHIISEKVRTANLSRRPSEPPVMEGDVNISLHELFTAIHGESERTPQFVYLSIWHAALTNAAKCSPKLHDFFAWADECRMAGIKFATNDLSGIHFERAKLFLRAAAHVLDGVVIKAMQALRTVDDPGIRSLSLETLLESAGLEEHNDMLAYQNFTSEDVLENELALLGRYFVRSFIIEKCHIDSSSTFADFIAKCRANGIALSWLRAR